MLTIWKVEADKEEYEPLSEVGLYGSLALAAAAAQEVVNNYNKLPEEYRPIASVEKAWRPSLAISELKIPETQDEAFDENVISTLAVPWYDPRQAKPPAPPKMVGMVEVATRNLPD